MKETKEIIYPIRLTHNQRDKLNKKAEDLGMRPSELMRTHLLRLFEYGAKDRK